MLFIFHILEDIDEIKKGFKLDGEEISDEKIKNIMYASDVTNRKFTL